MKTIGTLQPDSLLFSTLFIIQIKSFTNMRFALALLCVTLAAALPGEYGGDKGKWGDDGRGGSQWAGSKDTSVKVVNGGNGGGVGGSVGTIGVGTGGGGKGGNCDPVACDIKVRYI